MPADSAASPSPSRGTLSKLRRNAGDSKDSTNSLESSSNSDNPTVDSALQSTDSGFGKLRDRIRRKSVDDRGGKRGSQDSGRRLSALIPSRRNKLSKVVSSDLQQQSSVNSSTGNLEISGNRSDSSLGVGGSGHSSLLTDDDSDHESNPFRPTLSAHPSHAGYLTLSSPEINSQSRPVATGFDVETSPEPRPVSSSTTNIPQIVEPYQIEPLPPPVTGDRSSSPTKRFKTTFSLPSNQSAGDTESVKSQDSGRKGSGGLFKTTSRSNSIQEGVATEQTDESAQQELLPSYDQSDTSQERPETPKRSGRPRINTASLPQTPPNLTETPTTFVTPPTPTDPNANASTFPKKALKKSATSKDRSSSPESIKHRRAQSANLPSKLSQSIPAPLTPTVEETKTPGGTLTQPTTASGFFSSFFSAAQKAADSLSTSLNNPAGQNTKGRVLSSQLVEEEGGEEVIPGAKSQSDLTDVGGEQRQPAVETLGSGDLNFGHLGISDSPGTSPMVSSSNLPLQNGVNDEAYKKAEEEAAARAVSEAYEKPIATVVSQATGTGRPLSIASTDRLTLIGDQTPPRSGKDGEGVKRSGSVQSKVSDQRTRKHRGSSATTGGTNSIAAALTASATGLGTYGASGPGHRLTGFAVASNKRNKDFHQLFRSVPEDDYLIEDYSAALQRDILLHGRLYVSEGHICFSSNILGWVTNLVISFDEVVSVEKKSTAVIFPNAIVIQTLNARNTFASFVARDSTYELLIGIWKISHPNLKSSLNGVTLDNAGTGDKTEVADPEASEGSADSGSEDEVYDEDADDDAGSFEGSGIAPSIAGSDVGDKTLSRKTSTLPLIPTAPQTNGIAPKGLDIADATVAAAVSGQDFSGPATHEPTQCADEHYDRPLTDVTIPAPLGKVYSLMYGPASAAFMKKWLVDDQKSRELNMADDKFGLDHDHKTFTFDYIKPLNAPVGPKQTKCITTNTLVAFDLEKAVSIDCGTITPDVPSGNIFTTKTRYCLTWGPGNSTRLVANCTIEWTGKSWLKGPIEKGANDGQTEYVKALVASLKAAVASKAPAKGVGRKGRRKGKRDAADADETMARKEVAAAPEQQVSSWGPLEPLHEILKLITGIFGPMVNSQVVIAVLLTLVLYNWINSPGGGGVGVGLPGYTSPERLAAYEEIWRREESNLWDWLEDRVGIDNIYEPSAAGNKQDRQKVLAARQMGKKLDDERMTERQMDDAIRTTEERLLALKDAMAMKKEKKKSKR